MATAREPYREGADEPFDVVICGTGMAGAALARHLSLWAGGARVLVIDRRSRPFPEAAFKVGESTVDPGGKYLADVLRLRDYLSEHHVEKFGFRFFITQRGANFCERPEIGRAAYNPLVAEYQIDRGRFENDMRADLVRRRVHVLEGTKVEQIELSEPLHSVRYRTPDGELHRVKTRWVVDASGRHRMLRRQLGLAEEQPSPNSAVWFRIRKPIDVSRFVAPQQRSWHERVPGNHPSDGTYGRRNSTIHLTGKGYWVWVIPLPQATSIGIVTREGLVPFAEYHRPEAALRWLAEREPELAAAIGDEPLMDWGARRNYAYMSRQVISEQRWACVGEAAMFSDPYFANGADLIAMSNSAVVEAIVRDAAGESIAGLCTVVNDVFLAFVRTNTDSLQVNYEFFDDPVLVALKFFWDGAWFLGFHGSYTYDHSFTHDLARLANDATERRVLTRLIELNRVMVGLFRAWGARSSRARTFAWVDYFSALPLIGEMGRRNFSGRIDPSRPRRPGHAARVEDNLRDCETMAVALFRLAVEDCLPDQVSALGSGWLNAWALSLDPTRWDEDGLHEPTTAPHDEGVLLTKLHGLFTARPLPLPLPSTSSLAGVAAIARAGLVSEALKLARTRVNPDASARDCSGAPIPRDVMREAGQIGLLRHYLSTVAGGDDVDPETWGHVLHELGRGCADASFLLLLNTWVGVTRAIAAAGRSELVERYVRPMASGELQGAFCYTDGGDAFALTTRARSEAGDVHITGTKHLVTGAMTADVFMTYARDERDDVVVGLIHRDDPGVSVVAQPTAGMRAAGLATVSLDDVRIPPERILQELDGVSHAQTFLNRRALLVAGPLGAAEQLLAECIAAVTTTARYGRLLRDFGNVQATLGEMVADIEGGWLLLQSALKSTGSANGAAFRRGAVAKYAVTQCLLRAGQRAQRLLGGRGFVRGSFAERFVRDMAALIPGAGTQDILVTNLGDLAIAESTQQRSQS